MNRSMIVIVAAALAAVVVSEGVPASTATLHRKARRVSKHTFSRGATICHRQG